MEDVDDVEMRKVEDIEQIQRTVYRGPNTTDNRRVNSRLLGEIAFQLDRRIFSHIFEGAKRISDSRRRRRYYGFSVANIRQQIENEAAETETKALSLSPQYHLSKSELNSRCDDVFQVLRTHGYREDYHPLFSCRLVNEHGLTDGWVKHTASYQDPDVLKAAVDELAIDDEKRKHVMILLNCLTALANTDGQALILY